MADSIDGRPGPPDTGLLRSNTQADLFAKGGKGLLSFLGASAGFALAGPIGAIAGDLLVEFIPRQRQDRLQEFVEMLNERLGGIEAEVRAKLATSAGYASITEQAMFAAVRTASHDRRRHLVELLRTGLSKDEAELVEHETLLRLLDRLNDPQVLLLAAHAEKAGAGGPWGIEVLADGVPFNADGHSMRRFTMYRAYADELKTLGLMKDTEGVAKSSWAPNMEITHLGRLLLGAIRPEGPADAT